MIRQAELAEQPLRDPAATVVGSQGMILHYEDSRILLLDHHATIRNQNAEIGDRRLRPLLEPLSNRAFVLDINGIELAIFC